MPGVEGRGESKYFRGNIYFDNRKFGFFEKFKENKDKINELVDMSKNDIQFEADVIYNRNKMRVRVEGYDSWMEMQNFLKKNDYMEDLSDFSGKLSGFDKRGCYPIDSFFTYDLDFNEPHWCTSTLKIKDGQKKKLSYEERPRIR